MRDERKLRGSFFTSFISSRASFSRILIILSIAFWLLISYPLIAQAVTYPEEYLGEPGQFIAGFADEIKKYFDDYFGLLVSFVGVRYIFRAFLG